MEVSSAQTDLSKASTSATSANVASASAEPSAGCTSAAQPGSACQARSARRQRPNWSALPPCPATCADIPGGVLMTVPQHVADWAHPAPATAIQSGLQPRAAKQSQASQDSRRCDLPRQTHEAYPAQAQPSRGVLPCSNAQRIHQTGTPQMPQPCSRSVPATARAPPTVQHAPPTAAHALLAAAKPPAAVCAANQPHALPSNLASAACLGACGSGAVPPVGPPATAPQPEPVYFCTGGCGRSWHRWEDVFYWSKSSRKPWCSECGKEVPGPWNNFKKMSWEPGC